MHSSDDDSDADLFADALGGPLASDDLVDVAMQRRLAEQLFGEQPAPVMVGRFEIASMLGIGGMGMVLKAHDPKLRRDVAIKLVHGGDTHSAVVRRRLEQEAQALARFSHPNVVQVFEVGEHEGQLFLVMEYVDGGSLRDWASKTARSWRAILDIYLQAAAGLIAAHRAGIIHRDFKPSNVIVDVDGRARVADFGIARDSSIERNVSRRSNDASIGSGGSSSTRTGAVSGTLPYMSPEQATGRLLDARSDQFSFCVVVWEALSGACPYKFEELRDALAGMPLPEPHGKPMGPRWLRRILLRGLAVDPGQRWSSLEALVAATREAPVRRVRAGASLAAVGALAVGWLAWRHFDSELCPSGSSALAGVWDDERRAEMSEVFAGSGLSFADDSWRSVEDGLDAHADAWVNARDEICGTGGVRESDGDQRSSAVLECLDARRLDLEVTIDLLAGGRPSVLEMASELVDALEPPNGCGSSHEVASRQSMPLQAAFAGVGIAMNRDLAKARALVDAQLYQDALAVAEDAAADARRMGDDRRLAFSLQVLGTAAGLLGASEQSLGQLQESVNLALKLGDAELAARGWIAKAQVAIVELEDAARASEWVSHAAAILGEEMSLHVARDFAITRADLALLQGDHDTAFDLLFSARASATVVDSSYIRFTSRMARVRGEQGRLDESDELYAEAIGVQRDRLGENHPSIAKWNINLAVNEMSRDNPRLERAWALCGEALANYRRGYGEHDRRLAGVYVLMGSIAAQRGDVEQADALARNAVAIVRMELPVGHSERSGAIALLANLTTNAQQYDESLALHGELIAEYAAGADRRGLAEARQNSAWLRCRIDRCRGAQAEVDAARLDLTATDDLHVLLDVVEALIRLERRDARAALVFLEGARRRAPAFDAGTFPLLHPEIAAGIARALFALDRDLPRAEAMMAEAIRSYEGLNRPLDVSLLREQVAETVKHQKKGW